MAKHIPTQGEVNHASRNGLVHLAVTLATKFEDDKFVKDRERLLEDFKAYGKITGNYPWDPTNVGMDCPVPKALEFIERYGSDAAQEVIGIDATNKCFVPCYRTYGT